MNTIEKILLLDILAELEENGEKKEQLQEIYQRLVNDTEIEKNYLRELEKYEYNKDAQEQIKNVLDGLINKPELFINNSIELFNILNSMRRYSDEYSDYIENNILQKSVDFFAVDKTIINKYEQYNDTLYKLYLYKKIAIEGEKAIIIKYDKGTYGDWLDYYTNVVQRELLYSIKPKHWCIYRIQHLDTYIFEVVYLDKPFREFINVEASKFNYCIYINEKLSEKYQYKDNRVLMWGSGNIVNFNYNDMIKVIETEVVYKLPTKNKCASVNFSDPITTVSKYIGSDKFFCISPDDYVYLLNKCHQNMVVGIRSEQGTCVICGMRKRTFHKICERHINIWR